MFAQKVGSAWREQPVVAVTAYCKDPVNLGASVFVSYRQLTKSYPKPSKTMRNPWGKSRHHIAVSLCCYYYFSCADLCSKCLAASHSKWPDYLEEHILQLSTSSHQGVSIGG